MVAQAEKGDIGVYVTGLGTVTPLNTITVTTRVDGQLMMIDFALEAEREHHKTPRDAIREACLLRFRPIMG